MVKVNLKQGALKGQEVKLDNGVSYYEFLEIPYAKPPINYLRFQNPQPPEPWEGERFVAKATIRASQMHLQLKSVSGTEDCLYLNVFTRNIPTNDTKLLPVMVYIHGGAFLFGNGTIKEEAGEDFLMEQDIVLVTINYRLNVFGFLCLDIPEAPGNMGLKDQVMALKWVQDNIHKFGGDKHNVTVFGISAGAASIDYLILSEKSKNLFHKAIIQSGSSLNHWAISRNHKIMAYKLASQLGYQGQESDYKSIFEYITKHSTEEIQQNFAKIFDSDYDTRITQSYCFIPSIESDFGNGEAFITENPYNILKSGNFNKVLVIRGFCDREGVISELMAPMAMKTLFKTNNFVQHWPFVIDKCYNEKFLEAYVNNSEITNAEYALDFFSDFDFISGIWMAGRLMSLHMPVYMYELSYEGEVNFCKKLFGYKYTGCFHGDDTSYILKIPDMEPKSPNDKLFKNRLISMWTNFAKTGNPTPEIDSVITTKWPKFCNHDKQYLKMDINMTIKKDYEPKKMNIFLEIYEKYYL